ncbi:CoA transferase subunit A [Chelatococcus sp. GCM10030263]|uniref:CoA transferase subunit A n=1 Tax=Chelatococcus sp. GCM10030263 TaxID=3273387 RepID=UPI003610F8C2
MPASSSKVASLATAVQLIKDGDLVALGGHAGRRPPMALVCEILRQGRKGLHLTGWDGGVAFDLLAAAGCAERIDVGEKVRDGIRAAALGWPFVPLVGNGAAPALRPDVVLLHAHFADDAGNLRFAAEEWEPELPDLLLARSARTVIVSVEQLVSREAIAARPTKPFLAGSVIACVVEAPFGAYPGACETRYAADGQALAEAVEAARSPAALGAWLDAHVFSTADHAARLDRIGARRLMAVSTNRALRG